MQFQIATSKVVLGRTLILVLYTNGLFMTGNEPQLIKIREIWPLKFEMNNHGMMNYFFKFEKENLSCEAIKEFLESGNANPWTL